MLAECILRHNTSLQALNRKDMDNEAYATENGHPLPSNPPAQYSTDPNPPLDFDILDARSQQALSDHEWSTGHPPSSISYIAHDLTVIVHDGAAISVRILHPSLSRLDEKGEGKGLPVLFVTHGRGWMQGTHLSEEAWLYWYLCEEFDIVVVSVEYRLAPEHRFSVWIEDRWDVLEVVLASDTVRSSSSSASSAAEGANENMFARLDVALDLKKVFLAGSSSGAGTSAVLSQMCRDRNIPIAGVILNVPVVCDYRHFPSPSHTPVPISSYMQAIPTFSSSAMVTVWSTTHPSPNTGSSPKPLLY
ncbi:uncharacterized protein RAG0_00775 [Rhynchosporium agropyri]|uniref:Alpha/beta hydrolase fold-3 domain-containing protein n=1 Tax=Rhynchosporium agropyri TaxID=914238 RepID=A0A1E1JUI9_9HELO|nr:uncharacterized protein RAG0_00775 [Rhynchosporium agropyri]